MASIEEAAYMCANVVAAAKERAIMDAFNHYFGRADWTESDIANLDLVIDVDVSTGIEVLKIAGIAVLRFQRMETHVEVETGMVQCLYRQTITPLYSCCGVGE